MIIFHNRYTKITLDYYGSSYTCLKNIKTERVASYKLLMSMYVLVMFNGSKIKI